MNISSCTAHITDSRQTKNQKYSLESLMLIIFSSVISGYDTPNSMAEFAKIKQTWLQKYVTLNSIPCAETLRFFIA
ncbi:transposase family protein [Marinicellulosiphila megalodicopiae]|uniref:transposase family protein n=1 Tax=Marinicellulosiphila megalodicopiae TaxID=2724896 RepID=UPI003BB143F5